MLKNLDLVENAVWKQRFRASSILWATIANLNPHRGLVCTDRDGISQLYAWDVTSGDLRQLTDKPAGVVSGLLSADGEYIYFLLDDGGNEIGHYVRVPFAGGPPEDLTPDLPPYGSFVIAQSFDGNMLGTRVADASGYQLYAFASGHPPRQIYKSQRLFQGPSFSHNGDIVVIATTEGTNSLDTRLIAIDMVSGEPFAELWDGEGVSHELGDFAPQPGDFRMLSTTTKSGYSRPIIWNPRIGERRDLVIDEIPGEVEPWRWSRDAGQVLLSQLYQAKRQLYLYDLETDTVTKIQHPAGLVGSYFDYGTMTDGDEILITWQDPAQPARLIALDFGNKEEPRTVLTAGEVPAGTPWKSTTFTSENGTTIHAWLAVPEGEGPFPTILHVKGGPTSVMFEYFYPECQAWLDHGFAFFSINYHGATTFGKAFEKSIMGQLGELEVQDMAAGYKCLVDSGIARPEEVFVAGDSYGGFLALHAMGKRPDLWAGGMAGVAIADWTMLYEDTSDALRGYQRALFGGTPEEKPEAHKKSSPITYAEQVQAPILVIQGSNDTRCAPRQMEAYEAKLKSLGKQIEVHWFEAGHGSRAQEQRLEHQELKMRFVYGILNQRAD
jgi:dipeptidyl aminopeptidase/acylaminoacyl peptidase